MLKKYFMLTLVVVVASSIIIAAQPRGGAAAGSVYTAQQAGSGRAVYQANCAICHQQDLSGSGDAPTLRGSEFTANWGPRTTRELLSFLQLTMPPAQQGVLSQDEYLSILAFILQSNGAPAEGRHHGLHVLRLALHHRRRDRPERLPPAPGR